MTDAELLRGVRQADAQAWRTLYQRYLPSVWRWSCAQVSDMHAAEDVTSETMLALLGGIESLDVEKPRIGAWLRSVVQRKAADHYRSQFRDEQHLASLAELYLRQELETADGTEVAELRERVSVTLGALTDRQRLMLEWKYLDALSVREIADRLGETIKGVESSLFRARNAFRRLFQSAPLASADRAHVWPSLLERDPVANSDVPAS